ncbi:hypothetical protein IL306_004071 [Fusarium sp. DS 682]|nr:hypothetical protein IL306_004071 [Fusarium sp. DS 682]
MSNGYEQGFSGRGSDDEGFSPGGFQPSDRGFVQTGFQPTYDPNEDNKDWTTKKVNREDVSRLQDAIVRGKQSLAEAEAILEKLLRD